MGRVRGDLAGQPPDQVVLDAHEAAGAAKALGLVRPDPAELGQEDLGVERAAGQSVPAVGGEAPRQLLGAREVDDGGDPEVHPESPSRSASAANWRSERR